jgi:hypothetical protein
MDALNAWSEGRAVSLREARIAFTLALSRLIVWANDHLSGFGIAFGEGLVALTDAADKDYDGPHLKGGGHYNGLAVDLLIYDPHGDYITRGDHPAYVKLGEQWERMDSLARWGGRFKSRDGNHFSFAWDGKA